MGKKDGSFMVLFRDDLRREVFMIYRSDWPIWNLPGGGMEKGESPEETVVRETREETGFEIAKVAKLGAYEVVDMVSGELINRVYLFEGRVRSGVYRPEFPGCRGRWFAVRRLPWSMTENTRTRIKDAAGFDGELFRKKAYKSSLVTNWRLLLRHPVAAWKYMRKR